MAENHACEGGVWRVAEYAADVGQLNDLECGIILNGISEVLTLAHDEVNSYEALGFEKLMIVHLQLVLHPPRLRARGSQESQAYNLLSHQMQL